MNNFPVKLQYVPLTFINTDNEKIRQIKNTIINKHVLLEKNETKKLASLIINSQYGYTTSAKPEGNYKLLRITDIKNGSVNWDNVPFCECESPEKYLLKPNDILIARTGNNISYLVPDDVPSNAIFASYLIRFTCNEKLNPEYFFTFLNSYAFWSQILAKQQGALLQNVNAKRMGELIIPYCSIEKQKEVLRSNKEIQKDIERTLNLYKLITSTSSESINQSSYLTKLRQAILQEAIEGKLTVDWRKENPARKGDPDFDAEALLEKIQAEKEKLIKEGKIKKQKTLAPIKAEEVPFELPVGWVWTRLGEVCHIEKGSLGITKAIPGEYPLVALSEERLSHNEYQFNCSAVIIPLISSTGHGHASMKRIHYQEGKFSVGNILCCVYPKFDSVLNMKFLYIYLDMFKEKFFVKKMKGAANVSLNISAISETPIPLIPIHIQNNYEKIVKIIDELEKQVSERKVQSEQLMQAVLREAFEGGR